MAWFKKEKKPRLPRHEKHEIPPDAWEKCDACGHIDIREKFEKAHNVCPECGRHRRINAEEYIELLTDPGTWRELYGGLRSTGRLDSLPINLGVMNFAFMGGSMGSVVGEKIARLTRRSHEKKLPLVIVSA